MWLLANFVMITKINTVNGKRFDGLNICGFGPMKFFAGILLQYLASGVYYLNIGKYSRKNFHDTLIKTVKTAKV